MGGACSVSDRVVVHRPTRFLMENLKTTLDAEVNKKIISNWILEKRDVKILTGLNLAPDRVQWGCCEDGTKPFGSITHILRPAE